MYKQYMRRYWREALPFLKNLMISSHIRMALTHFGQDIIQVSLSSRGSFAKLQPICSQLRNTSRHSIFKRE